MLGILLLLMTFALSGATIGFEGLPDNTPVADAFASLGVTFTGATAFIDTDAGGTGDFGGEPSSNSAAFTEFGITIDVPAGIAGTLSFYFANPHGTTNVRAYKQVGAAGSFIEDVYLPATPLNGAPDPSGSFSPFVFVQIPLAGVRQSVQIVSRVPGGMYIDDVTLSSVPEPAYAPLLLAAAAGILYMRRKHA